MVSQPLNTYRWSSWPEYLKAPSKRWPWLRVDRLLGEHRIPKDSAAGRRVLEAGLESRRGAEDGKEFKAVRRGWCLGAETFREELLGRMKERLGAEHYGEERQATAEEQAEWIVAEELNRRGWREADLEALPKGDADKVAMTMRLRAETTMPVKWIAERLHMGTPGHVNHLLWKVRKGVLPSSSRKQK